MVKARDGGGETQDGEPDVSIKVPGMTAKGVSNILRDATQEYIQGAALLYAQVEEEVNHMAIACTFSG